MTPQFDIRDYVTAIVAGAVLLWDFFLARKGEGGTLSWRWAMWSRKWPVIPFLVGVLCGHLFFPNREYAQPVDALSESGLRYKLNVDGLRSPTTQPTPTPTPNLPHRPYTFHLPQP